MKPEGASLNTCQGQVPFYSAERVFTEGKLVVLVLFKKPQPEATTPLKSCFKSPSRRVTADALEAVEDVVQGRFVHSKDSCQDLLYITNS